jgi:hypothetical protein
MIRTVDSDELIYDTAGVGSRRGDPTPFSTGHSRFHCFLFRFWTTYKI